MFPLSSLGASTCTRHERPLSAKDGIMGEKWPVNFACDFDFHVNPGFFDMPRKSATWETALLPPQGRHAVDFFARKIRRLRSGSNPRSWVPKASMLTTEVSVKIYWKLSNIKFNRNRSRSCLHVTCGSVCSSALYHKLGEHFMSLASLSVLNSSIWMPYPSHPTADVIDNT